MHKQRIIPVVTALLITLLGVTPAHAAITYASSLEQNSTNFTYATGTSSVSELLNIAGFGFITGTVTMVGTNISYNASAATGAGTVADIDVFGQWVVDDLIFTNISDPAATGTIAVSANFFLQWSTADGSAAGDELNAQASFSGGSVLNQTFPNPVLADLTTAVANVPLGVPVTFSASARLRLTDSIAGTEGGSGVFNLLATDPFNLPAGFTVNSVSAGIVNNATAVPLPAAVYLLGAGLLGLFGCARRSQLAAGSRRD